MSNYRIDQEHIHSISNDLQEILDYEISLGNSITETWKGWPYDRYVVGLQRPFNIDKNTLKENLEYRRVNDPHYWKAEIFDKRTKDMLICGFK